jgi:hypothetical protein
MISLYGNNHTVFSEKQMAIVEAKALGIRNTEELNRIGIPRNHHHMRFEELLEDEYTALETTNTKAHALLSDVQLFVIAEWNYQEYCDTVEHYRQVDFQKLQTALKSRRLILDINRSLLNLLSAVRMYLDHTETSIKRRHGHESLSIKKFKEVCSKVYDTSFAYRGSGSW